jgi:hypothetical protein
LPAQNPAQTGRAPAGSADLIHLSGDDPKRAGVWIRRSADIGLGAGRASRTFCQAVRGNRTLRPPPPLPVLTKIERPIADTEMRDCGNTTHTPYVLTELSFY